MPCVLCCCACRATEQRPGCNAFLCHMYSHLCQMRSSPGWAQQLRYCSLCCLPVYKTCIMRCSRLRGTCLIAGRASCPCIQPGSSVCFLLHSIAVRATGLCTCGNGTGTTCTANVMLHQRSNASLHT